MDIATATAVGRSGSAEDRLSNPHLARGTAFDLSDRRRFGLDGLLPPAVETLDAQVVRVLANLRAKAEPLEKYRYLRAIQDANETLFHRAVLDHLEEMLPIVYTPTVGVACTEWSRIFERPRGLYVSARQHRGRVAEVLRHWPVRHAGIIVVTDGGRILGLGDLGANGMGIPIGKLALYSICAGIPPQACLPITLDVGTDNLALRADPMYLGERHARLNGPEYDRFIEEFVSAVQQVFPDAVLQFEDFNNASAFALLDRYRDRLCCFDDDVQGTGAMGLAGLYSAGRLTGRCLTDERVLFAGAGEASLGIGALLVSALRRDGLTDDEARARCLFIDSRGLVTSDRDDLPAHKRRVARQCARVPDLVSAVGEFKPTVLIGASGQGGLFTRPVLEALASATDRPVVFALSNPTAKSECTAERAYVATNGRAVFASGSPFASVVLRDCEHCPGQANNSYVFPGVGLGLLVSGATRASDEMFFAAARALASQVSGDDLRVGRIFPVASRMREVARAVAIAVVEVAYAEGLATRPEPASMDAAVDSAMWWPAYA